MASEQDLIKNLLEGRLNLFNDFVKVSQEKVELEQQLAQAREEQEKQRKYAGLLLAAAYERENQARALLELALHPLDAIWIEKEPPPDAVVRQIRAFLACEEGV